MDRRKGRGALGAVKDRERTSGHLGKHQVGAFRASRPLAPGRRRRVSSARSTFGYDANNRRIRQTGDRQ
jgi:hypothetical protein